MLVCDKGRGSFTHCNIHSNNLPGVQVQDTADPQVERCTIHNGKSLGVAVGGQGRGAFTHCNIHSNAQPGVRAQDTADPQVERCTIHNRKSAGVATGVFAFDQLQGARPPQ